MQMRFAPTWLLLSSSMLLLTLEGCSQKGKPTTTNRYGLHIIQTIAPLLPAIQADSPGAMVRLNRYLHPLLTNWIYATPNNFTHQILYTQPEAYLRLEAAKALQQVQDTLHTLGFDIQLYDAYRPYSVTEKMWQIVPDERYAANPANGSGHNRGVAVDVTLVDSTTGEALPMPTGFDNFTDTAHHSFMNLPVNVLKNRALLKKVMEQYGFVALATEWWHYSLPNPKRYALLDVGFDEMKKATKK
jgi:zinc D-Ala-D-Ala dipeptidase